MSTKKKLQQLDEDLDSSFSNVKLDINNLHGRIDRWSTQFGELRNELATNGVVGNLHRLEKECASFERQIAAEMEAIHGRFAELEANGVVAQLNKLTREVFRDKKEASGSRLEKAMFSLTGFKPMEEATLAGKVDAIIEHLGLDITVKSEEVIKSQVVTKKVAAPKKKAGKK